MAAAYLVLIGVGLGVLICGVLLAWAMVEALDPTRKW